jgi:iron complex outermembrane recepter protein
MGAVTVKYCRSIASCACALALLIGMLVVIPTRAADTADKTYHFDIPAEALSQALRTFGQTAGKQIIFTEDLVSGLPFSGLHGDFSAEVALQRLLQGTGLVSERTPAGVIMIRRAVRSTDADDRKATPIPAQSPSDAVRVAQADQGRTSTPSTVEKPDEQASKTKPIQLEEVVVTGSRIPEPAGATVQPIQIYTREMIQQSGQTSIADFLNTLPDVSISSNEAGFQTFAGQTTVALHGLPIGTTLVLLNGRRVESSYNGFFDLSNIPAAAVERIEVLPVGGSAVYGSDALAGAVNIILRKDLNGFDFDVKGGHAKDYNEQDADFSWGHSGENGSISLVGSWQHRSELLGSERAFSSITSVPPGQPSTGTLVDYCHPGNIYSLNGAPLPGLGTATEAGIPAGLKGLPTTQSFLATAGVLSLCSGSEFTALIPRTDREGALLSANYAWSSALDLFTETMFAHEQPNQLTQGFIFLPGGSYGAYTMGAGNPYNPFGEPIGVSYEYPGIPEYNNHTATFVRPLVGLRGTIATDWTYELTVFYSEDRTRVEQANADPVALQTALNSSDPATALNPFSGGAPGTPQLLQSLISSADLSVWTYVDQLTGGQAWVRGPVVNLPAGPLQTVVGAEYTHETQTTVLPLGSPPFDLERTTAAVFGEAKIPLIGSGPLRRDGDRLALNIAARYDHSDDFGGKATWQGGLTWRPISSLLFRVGYATSYQAPQLQEIGGGIQGTFAQGVTDPFRGNETANVPTSYGANPNLAPETGHARNFGVVYVSDGLPGLQASLTQFAIAIQNYIGSPTGQVLVDNPTLFPGAVTRAPATPQDQQMGWLGPITSINELYYNYGDLDVSGADLDLSYKANTALGDFTPSIALANLYKWESALTPGSRPLSYLSQATLAGPGWAPRWKGTTALGWTRGVLSGSITGRYVGRYRDYQDFVPNNNNLGNFWIADATFHVDLGKSLEDSVPWASKAGIDLGVVNLFDKAPQFSNGIGFDPEQADLRGRFAYVQLSVKL